MTNTSATLRVGISSLPSTFRGVVSAAAGPRPGDVGRLLRVASTVLEYLAAVIVLSLYALAAVAPVAYEVGL